MSGTSLRFPAVEALRALASQLIVLHHIAFYGPMSDVAQSVAPDLLAWLSQHGRLAVQVFFVLAGFMAARGLAPDGRLRAVQPLHGLVWQRYLRVGLPYLAMLALSLVAAALARELIDHDSIPQAPDLFQLAAHVLLLQNLLGVESLSAGVWYVAIDLQLFALFAGLLALSRRTGGRHTSALLVSCLALASLFYFNRDAMWDVCALYFFAAYAAGALAWWIGARRDAPSWLLILAIVATLALMVDFRTRIAVAAATALLLGFGRYAGWLSRPIRLPGVAFLGRISYALFLVHFPVFLIVNAAFSRFVPEVPELHALGMVLTWLISICAASLFHYRLEVPLVAWATRPRAGLGDLAASRA
ncbi:hypothetical protein GCM10025771_11420 [Niveibacterium umoris]|uniref:Peptidoglycan/LPS O-acetylase OafA/YrhL n=1 Tax=Niveibacterium umoris TaxID=1193620 RepID=A0A840BJ98_9RHOO|nr:acyltransferase [Niveibacterium umoris]MBB4013305.1 peptidoglycan/LPS O-acetylase OafA/YrhL [Niveibacterium umoris]